MGSSTWDHLGFCPKCNQETDQQTYNDNDDTGNHTTCLECECDIGEWFKESVYEIAFGDNAINRDFSPREVIEELKKFSDKALELEDIQNNPPNYEDRD